jgi:FkbM family methyltransferase
MKNTIRRLRSNYFIAKFLTSIFKPIFTASSKLIRLIPIRIRPNEETVKYHGYELFFPRGIGGSILNRLYWESDGFETDIGALIAFFSKKYSLFLDVGSNIGFYSVFSHKVNPEILSYCFEPVQSLAQKNLFFHKSNQVFANYKLYSIALSDTTGIAKMFIPELDEFNETTTASLNNNFFYNQNRAGTYHEIEISTLDMICSDIDLNKYKSFFIKIDVEGHEIEVLKGFLRTINFFSPVIIIELEMTKFNLDKFFNLEFHKNYLVYKIINGSLVKINRIDIKESKSAENFLLIPRNIITTERIFIPLTDISDFIN